MPAPPLPATIHSIYTHAREESGSPPGHTRPGKQSQKESKTHTQAYKKKAKTHDSPNFFLHKCRVY